MCLNLHRGIEDDRLLERQGAAAFRQARIADLCQEALSQGGLLTAEDLAYRVFFVSPRTITRDLAGAEAMASAPDPLRKRFAPLQAKALKTPSPVGSAASSLASAEHASENSAPRWSSRSCRPTSGPRSTSRTARSSGWQSPSTILRLCQQAYRQGGLLSNCDLAELLATHDERVSRLLTHYEREQKTVVPRRATLHDVGSGTTHKRIICHKRYAEGKPSDQVARETYHSLEAVDRYLGQYDRVRHCRLQGLSPEQTAHILDCSLRLVREYLAIDRELEPCRA